MPGFLTFFMRSDPFYEPLFPFNYIRRHSFQNRRLEVLIAPNPIFLAVRTRPRNSASRCVRSAPSSDVSFVARHPFKQGLSLFDGRAPHTFRPCHVFPSPDELPCPPPAPSACPRRILPPTFVPSYNFPSRILLLHSLTKTFAVHPFFLVLLTAS